MSTPDWLSEPSLLEGILPESAVSVETRRELVEVELFSEEREIVAGAVTKRRNEFVTARACARVALLRLGIEPQPILAGVRGEPRWPAGVVGSITHCKDYRACVLGRAQELATVGIDAERNEPLPDGVLEAIADRQEKRQVQELLESQRESQLEGQRAVRWDRLLFSAKESIYKAWYPLTERWLGFEDARVELKLDGRFVAKLLVEPPQLEDGPLDGFQGRWTVADGLILTAIARRAPNAG